MTAFSPERIDVFAGAVALLCAATLAGLLLRQGARTPERRATIDNLNARIRSWWVMVALFGAATALGRGVTLAFFGALSFLALRNSSAWRRPGRRTGRPFS